MSKLSRLVGSLALFVLTPLCAEITGTVMTREGKPIGGATVQVFAMETADARLERLRGGKLEREPLLTVTTSAAGEFKLGVKPHGSVTVGVTDPRFTPAFFLAAADDELGAIALWPASMKTGRVTANGKPVSAAVVRYAGGGEYVTRTDEQGKYSVPDPHRWAASVEILHPDYARYERFGGGRFDKLPLDHALKPGVAVSGKIVEGDGTTPAANAQLFVDNIRLGESAADGTFTLQHVPAEWRELAAISGAKAAAVTRQAGANVGTLKLMKRASVSGVVRDARTGKAVSGVLVGLSSGGRFRLQRGRDTLSGAKGYFAFNGVLPGRYELTAMFAGTYQEPLSITVREADNVVRSVTLQPTGRISGTVVDQGKQAIPAATIKQEIVDDFRPGMLESTLSGPDGRFVVRNVRPDVELTLTATRKGQPPAKSSPMKLGAGEVKSNVLLTLATGIAVRGVVTNKQGEPVANATITARESEGPRMMRRFVMGGLEEEEEKIRTARDGAFELRLKEGTHDIVAAADGYAPTPAREIRVGAATEPVEIVMEEGVEIAGRVVRKGGAGIADVRVMTMAAMEPNTTTTAPDGSFVLRNLKRGPAMINFFDDTEMIREIRNVTAPASDLVVEVASGGVISGRVLDRVTKKPVTDFQAGVSGERGAGGMRMVMPTVFLPFRSDEGAFTLEHVPAGNASIIVTAPGYVRTTQSGLTVEEGKPLKDVEITLEPAARVSGKVTGPDGIALAGVSVTTMAEGRGMMARFEREDVQSDSNGEYELDTQAPGETTIVFSKDGYSTERKTVKLDADGTRVDVRLTKGRPVVGVVVNESGMPVAGAEVMVEGQGMWTARSDESGNFRFESLKSGRYTFTASKSGYAQGSLKDVDVDTADTLKLTVRQGGVITGRVVGIDPSEISESYVTADVSGSGMSRGAIRSDGSFRIEGVPPGTARVTAAVNRFPNIRRSASRTVTVTAGSEVSVDLEFDQGIVITGRVTRGGEAVSGATVMFQPLDTTSRTMGAGQTATDGSYEVSGLRAGKYVVAVTDMSRSASHELTHSVDRSGTLDIDMKAGLIRGRVVDADTNAAIGEALVNLENADATLPRFIGRNETTSTAAGEFTIASVSPGTYRLRANRDGYAQGTAQVTITGDESRDVQIRLVKQGSSTLRVVDARDGRSLPASVIARDANGVVVYQEWFPQRGDGLVKLPLPTGSYRVTVRANNYAARIVTVTAPTSEMTVGLTPGGKVIVESSSSETRAARFVTSSGEPYVAPRLRETGETAIDAGQNVFDLVAPGAYIVQILNPNGTVAASHSFHVVEGQTTVVKAGS